MWFFNKKKDKKDYSVPELWEEFRDAGLVWFVNMILHLFGWVLVVRMEDGHVVNVYPHRTRLRGFEVHTNTEGYQRVSKYMKENAKKLYEETKT